ncbi:UNVERIFIED_CONTAM: LINE-1 retrotransposable element O protein [Sesamum latifolium]|uniref:LINE-1 retrotransposable element O protein n=1 Tax=Sesamum latifolium TaxID=2727402 RepID=A0AAW2WE50_9LAMI
MDSPNSLSSLTHTTPKTHTTTENPNSATADDDPSGTVRALVAGEHGRETPAYGVNPKDFNLGEFLALANRVVDVGDAESLAALESLKRRWVEKYGDGEWSTPEMGLKPVAARQPTPFPPPMRAPRRAIRNVIPLNDWGSPPLLLAPPGESDASGSLPNLDGDDEAPPPRVFGTHSDFMQIRVPPLAPPIAESSQAIVVGGGPRLVEDVGQTRTVPNPTLIDPAVGEGGVLRSAAPRASFRRQRLFRHTISRVLMTAMVLGHLLLLLLHCRTRLRWCRRLRLILFTSKWEPGMVLRKLQHTQVPVWIKLRQLPVELWTTEGLSTVASGIGKPLYPDAITRACTRLNFARVCVMLDISSKLPKHIVIMVPREDGSESTCKVDVEYEWLPPKCNACMSLGHPTKSCPTMKPKPPPISVYVHKPPPPAPRVQVHREPLTRDGSNTKETWVEVGTGSVGREDMGKAIVLYNAFDTCLERAGPERRDHQVSVIDLVSEHRLQFIGLLETRVAVRNVARVQRGLLPRWNWFVDYAGPGNRVWLAWDDDFIDVDVLDTGDQFVHCSVHIRLLHMHVFITVVYGVNDVIGRRVLWADLHRLSLTVTAVPWLVGGHFNTVVDVSEVCRQSGDIRGAAEEFQGCLRDTGLINLPMQGEWFTWHNCSRDSRSLWKRLDPLLVNDGWLESWPNTSYVSLNARTSDHSPLVLRGDTPGQAVSMFRFDNYLAHSAEFIPSVRRIWQHRIGGTTMFAVTRKLKALKPVFRAQRQKKGDLSNNVELAASFLEMAQGLLARDRHSTLLLHLEFCCKMVLRLASRMEQNMLHQRTKLAWMKDRDQCSRIFFRKVAKRRSSKRVFQIMRSDGQVLTTQPAVTNEFVTYYQTLLGDSRLSPDEIKQAVFDIDEIKAPGLDGYSAGFFKAAWPVVGGEVTQAILEFFATGRLLKQVNSTLISLIPKVNNPTVVAEFRPISCCNVLYKVITKILVQRMQGILDSLISPSQNAFVPGRSIGDNILLAQELFNGYNQQTLPPRCALKVDLRKAYDTVEWDFLRSVLTLFRFPEQFILWIVECVTTPSFSVCLNGAPHGFFRGARGLRQGDPMSPYLFVLVMEMTCFYLARRTRPQFRSSNGLTTFADLLGLHANVQKSHLILSRSAGLLRDALLAILDFQEGHLPLRYLGLSLLASRLSMRTVSDSPEN